MVKILPDVIFSATKHNKPLGAFRVYFLAKSWDVGGSGFIPMKSFRSYLKGLGIPRADYYRWIEQAHELGLFRRSGEAVRLVSWQRACLLAGHSKSRGFVSIETEQFIAKGWLSICWAAFVSSFKGPVSRAAFERLSGVPERTQREYERKAQVLNFANYAHFDKVADNPEQAIAHHGEPGYYTKAGENRRRLPNSRAVADGIQSARKGRIKKINRLLDELFLSDAASNYSQIVRLYSDNSKQTQRLKKLDRKNNDAKHRPGYIYELCRRIPTGEGVFHAVAL